MGFISIGLGNWIACDKITAIVSPESAPVKRLVQEAKDSGTIIDSTYGRRTKAVIVMTTGQVVLSPILPDTIINKVQKNS